MTATATDAENDPITFTLTGSGSENFAVDNDGTVTLLNSLDYESVTSYELTLSASDGTNTVSGTFTFTVVDVNEAVTLSTSLAASSFAENLSLGSTLLSSSATDPENSDISYSLSGTGSDKFSVASDGTVTLSNSLNYESETSYDLTLTASDGTNSTSSSFTILVTNIDETVDLTTSLAANSFDENTTTGTVIATATATDPEGDTVTFSLSGTGSDKFSVSSDGTITLTNALDYETDSSYTLTLSATDGTNTTTTNITVTVDNINEDITLSTSVAASSFAEDISTGTTIATASVTNPENATISYTLSGTGSDKFSVSSDGTISLTSGLDYESISSYSLTLTASDGTNSTSESIAFSVGDVNEVVALSTTLAASSFLESTSTGTTIATASATDPENAIISYSLSGTGSDKFSVSSNGTVTLSSGLDYESTTSYSLTLTASDGTNSTSESIAFSVGDVNEAVALSTSVAASSFAEDISTGTTIATASATDPENATISYTLSGTGSDKFSVSSDGTVTLSSGLDYDNSTTYNLTLTASDGTNSTTSSFTVGVTMSYSGYFAGIMEFERSSGDHQLASINSNSSLSTFTFDATNDDVKVVSPLTISAFPDNNYTRIWSRVDTGNLTLNFGDETNSTANSTYISKEEFTADLQDDGAQIDSSSGDSDSLTGVMVSFNSSEEKDSGLYDSMPNTDYSTWGFWSLDATDISPNPGSRNASVNSGIWVAGELVSSAEIPSSGTASMSGAAVVKAAYRYDQSGFDYGVQKYTTTADVAATFNWGSSGYSGTLAFTNFDASNPIIANAGFASFSVAITGTDNTYSGSSTDSIDNGWTGGASVQGALYGDSTVNESGGKVNVSLSKSGSPGSAGANDFYVAEGIYLVDCTSGTCQ